MLPDQLWQATLGELELTLSKVNFITWFRKTRILEIADGRVVVGVPSAFIKSWLESKYHKAVLKTLQHLTNNDVKEVNYRIDLLDWRRPEPAKAASSSVSAHAYSIASRRERRGGFELNPRYTFDNFVVGKGNELAHAASLAVIDSPGSKYNPLFLYGGVGLGKTHLMQAIGQALRQKWEDCKVLYVNFEQFTSDYVQATKEGKMKEFKAIYRTVDALLVDDIQFMAGKEQTQEEFFHTFEVLHQASKQIVVTSDRPPRAISTLQDRLISRFEWGMIADISAPDLETRLAIVRSKAEERGYELAEEVANYISHSFYRNIRELEGALNKLIAYLQVTKIVPTLDMAKEQLAPLLINPLRGALTTRQVIKTVAEFYDIPLDELIGASRRQELISPRQVAMYLLREELSASFPAIGADFGGRDHTTAMHACKKIAEFLERDDRLRQDMATIKMRLYQA